MSADPVDPGLAVRQVQRREGAGRAGAEDRLIQEVPVEVRYNGQPFAVMMLTPLDLEDFAYGFSLSEGRVSAPGQIEAVQVSEMLEGCVLEILAPSAAAVATGAERLLDGRSGCGLCGSRRLEDAVRQPAPVPAGSPLAASALERAAAALAPWQRLNAQSGAAHAAAWADRSGTVLCVREDVGRHNALDKLIGAMLRAQLDPRDGFVLVTSRASYEMVGKAASAGIGVLAAISAPTALAVDLARSCRMGLVGFLRPGRHVVYAGSERLPP